MTQKTYTFKRDEFGDFILRGDRGRSFLCGGRTTQFFPALTRLSLGQSIWVTVSDSRIHGGYQVFLGAYSCVEFDGYEILMSPRLMLQLSESFPPPSTLYFKIEYEA